jgi:hypothetical protein
VSRAQLVFVLSVADDVRKEQDLSSDGTETCSEERAKSGSVAGRDLREDRLSRFDQLARAYQRPARGAATTGCRICLDRDLEATSRASAQHDQRGVGSEDANVRAGPLRPAEAGMVDVADLLQGGDSVERVGCEDDVDAVCVQVGLLLDRRQEGWRHRCGERVGEHPVQPGRGDIGSDDVMACRRENGGAGGARGAGSSVSVASAGEVA